MRALLLVAVLVGMPMQAQAAFYDGNKLVKLMWEYEDVLAKKAGAKLYEAGQYSGFVVAVFDSLTAARVICASDYVDAGQVKWVVATWLKARPKDWHYTAHSLVRGALETMFPCG